MPLRVLTFEQRPHNALGGQERSLFEVSKALALRGHEVTLAYREAGNLLDEYAKFAAGLIQVNTSYTYKLGGSLRFLVALAHLILKSRAQRWDLIYVNQYSDSFFSTVLGQLLGIPVVIHLRLPPHPNMSRQHRLGIRRAAHVIAISHYIARKYRESGIPLPEISVVHNGVDLNFFESSQGEGNPRKRILFLGRIEAGKGLMTLLDAFERARLVVPSLTLTIAGNKGVTAEHEAFFNQVRSAIARFGDSAQLLQHQPDVRPLLADCDLLIVPSCWGEPFGRVVIEGMAAGVPVIASTDGGIPEILAEDFPELLFPVRNTEALASSIVKNIDWRQTDPGLGHAMRRLAEEKFSVSKTVDAIETVFLTTARGGK